MKAIVLLSGGMDSAWCAFDAARELGQTNVVAILVGYGQPHRHRELASAAVIAERLGIERVSLEVADALPRPHHMAKAGHATTGPHPATVPARNVFLLSSAASHAIARWPGESIRVVIGATADDRAFVDCRAEFVALARDTFRLLGVEVVAPLLLVTKRELVRRAVDDGSLDLLRSSWSCYRGGPHACGECTPCVVRADAFAAAGIEDEQIARPIVGGDPHRDRVPR